MQQTPSKAQLEQYIRQAARERGIDPEIAVKVARSEGLGASAADGWQSTYKKNGIREPSYGPFQLLVGGGGTGYPTGLGNVFSKQTGLDPKDPKTVYQQIDFALDRAATDGWGAWYGAKKVGVDNWDGLRNAAPRGVGPGPENFAGLDIPIPTMRPPDSAPVEPVQRGILASLFSQPTAQAGERQQTAPYSGNSILSDSLPFEPLRETGTGDPLTAAMPTTGGNFAVSTDPAYQFEFTPGFSPVEPVTPQRNFLPLYAPEVRPVGQSAPPAPAQQPMANADFASMASMPNYPGMNAPVGVDQMMTAAQGAMTGRPALDPSQPLDYPGIPVPTPRPMQPLPPPRQVAPPPQIASPQPMASTPPTPSMPSGMDVWQGGSAYGQATDGSTLSRNADGSVSRYSQQYDNWSTFDPQSNQWRPGGGPLGGSEGINLPSKDRAVGMGKSMLASAAGGMAGSALLGPVGGILGALVARNIANGNGLLSGLVNTPGGFPPAPSPSRNNNGFPSAPAPAANPNAPPSFVSTLDTSTLSPGVAEAIATGRGGLF